MFQQKTFYHSKEFFSFLNNKVCLRSKRIIRCAYKSFADCFKLYAVNSYIYCILLYINVVDSKTYYHRSRIAIWKWRTIKGIGSVRSGRSLVTWFLISTKRENWSAGHCPRNQFRSLGRWQIFEARKVMKTARSKAVIAIHLIDTSRIVTNAQGKMQQI